MEVLTEFVTERLEEPPNIEAVLPAVNRTAWHEMGDKWGEVMERLKEGAAEWLKRADWMFAARFFIISLVAVAVGHIALNVVFLHQLKDYIAKHPNDLASFANHWVVEGFGGFVFALVVTPIVSLAVETFLRGKKITHTLTITEEILKQLDALRKTDNIITPEGAYSIVLVKSLDAQLPNTFSQDRKRHWSWEPEGDIEKSAKTLCILEWSEWQSLLLSRKYLDHLFDLGRSVQSIHRIIVTPKDQRRSLDFLNTFVGVAQFLNHSDEPKMHLYLYAEDTFESLLKSLPKRMRKILSQQPELTLNSEANPNSCMLRLAGVQPHANYWNVDLEKRRLYGLLNEFAHTEVKIHGTQDLESLRDLLGTSTDAIVKRLRPRLHAALKSTM